MAASAVCPFTTKRSAGTAIRTRSATIRRELFTVLQPIVAACWLAGLVVAHATVAVAGFAAWVARSTAGQTRPTAINRHFVAVLHTVIAERGKAAVLLANATLAVVCTGAAFTCAAARFTRPSAINGHFIAVVHTIIAGSRGTMRIDAGAALTITGDAASLFVVTRCAIAAAIDVAFVAVLLSITAIGRRRSRILRDTRVSTAAIIIIATSRVRDWRPTSNASEDKNERNGVGGVAHGNSTSMSHRSMLSKDAIAHAATMKLQSTRRPILLNPSESIPPAPMPAVRWVVRVRFSSHRVQGA